MRILLLLAILLWPVPTRADVLFNDSFARADSTTLGGLWSEITGDMELANELIQNVSAATQMMGLNSTVFLVSNYFMAALISHTSTTQASHNQAISARYDGMPDGGVEDAYQVLRQADANDNIVTHKVVNGVRTVLITAVVITDDTALHSLMIGTNGNDVSMWFDNAQQGATVTDTGATPDGNYSGYRAFSSDARVNIYDRWVVCTNRTECNDFVTSGTLPAATAIQGPPSGSTLFGVGR